MCIAQRISAEAELNGYVLDGVSVNKIDPKKLLNSKWTAVTPTKKEKHFMVAKVEFDEKGMVIFCSIEALLSKRVIPINWHDLQNESNWVQGWK